MPTFAELNEQIDDLGLQLRAAKLNAKSLSRDIRHLKTENLKLLADLRIARSRR